MNKLTSKEWRSLLYEFTADPRWAGPALAKPFDQGRYVVATDTHAILRVSKELVPEEYPVAGMVPNVATAVPDGEPKFAVGISMIRGGLLAGGINLDSLSTECPECHGRGTVNWRYENLAGEEYDKVAECPVCDGSGKASNGSDRFFTIGLDSLPGTIFCAFTM